MTLKTFEDLQFRDLRDSFYPEDKARAYFGFENGYSVAVEYDFATRSEKPNSYNVLVLFLGNAIIFDYEFGDNLTAHQVSAVMGMVQNA